jgi:transcriptional regulator with XRE-family HTH domain
MSSAPTTHIPAARTSANINTRRTLQRVRRGAGYASAKDFAAEVGIPETTYARYERAPETPQCGIPMANAWAIADKLGCSIDLVVGREDIDAPRPVTLDDRARALTRESRRMLDDYLDYLEHRDAEDAQARR